MSTAWRTYGSSSVLPSTMQYLEQPTFCDSLRSISTSDLSARTAPCERSSSGLAEFPAPLVMDLSFLRANRGLLAMSFFELVLAERLANRMCSKNGNLHLPRQET